MYDETWSSFNFYCNQEDKSWYHAYLWDRAIFFQKNDVFRQDVRGDPRDRKEFREML